MLHTEKNSTTNCIPSKTQSMIKSYESDNPMSSGTQVFMLIVKLLSHPTSSFHLTLFYYRFSDSINSQKEMQIFTIRALQH